MTPTPAMVKINSQRLPILSAWNTAQCWPRSVVNATGDRLENASIQITAHGSQEVQTAFPSFTLAPLTSNPFR